MFNSDVCFVVSALTMLSAVSLTTAAPVGDLFETRGTEVDPAVVLCIGNFIECVTGTIPPPSECNNFTGGLTFLNKEVSAVVIPEGFLCSFFEEFGCRSAQGGEGTITLQPGRWSFSSVPGTAQPMANFTDLASSYICSPI